MPLIDVTNRAQMCLDGVTLLVRSKVDARETNPTTRSASASNENIPAALTEKLGTLHVSSGGKNKVGRSVRPGHHVAVLSVMYSALSLTVQSCV